MVRDPFATSRDGAINLGAHASSIVLARAASPVLLGDIFSDIGNWFENAIEDIGQAFEDAIAWFDTAFSDIARELVNGPILHIAAGVAALIPGAGPAIAGAIEAGYAGLKIIVAAAGEAIDAVRPIVEEAVGGLETVAGEVKRLTGQASMTWEAMQALPLGEAKRALSELEARASSSPTDARILLSVRFNMGVAQLVASRPELRQRQGAASIVLDTTLPILVRSQAFAVFMAGLQPLFIDPRQLAQWSAGALDLRNYKQVPSHYASQQSVVSLLNQMKLPLKIQAGSGVPSLAIAGAAESVGALTGRSIQVTWRNTDENITDGSTFAMTDNLLALSSAAPSRVTFSSKYQKDTLVSSTPGARPTAYVPWLTTRNESFSGVMSPKDTVAAWYKSAHSVPEAIAHWFARAPEAPSLVSFIVRHKAWPGQPPWPASVPTTLQKHLNELTGTTQSAVQAKRLGPAIAQLPAESQVALLRWLVSYPATVNNAKRFWGAIFPAFKSNKSGADYAQAFYEWTRDRIASDRAQAEAAAIATGALVSTTVANTPAPRVRNGLRVIWGELEAEDGAWRWLGEGLEVVVGADGTADAGKWERA